jgi:hypothetical protein
MTRPREMSTQANANQDEKSDDVARSHHQYCGSAPGAKTAYKIGTTPGGRCKQSKPR